jgi:pimeloyl-ACP methyl ester carboxylesterase
MKPIVRSFIAAAAAVSSISPVIASGESSKVASVPTSIVLAHGAFADGSAWARVIPLLQERGYKVIAVQNTLVSQEADVATTRRVIEAQAGPVIAVGHSYGGAVITGAAAGNPNVKALVYVAALAPDAGEVLGELYSKFGPSDLVPALVPDSAGFLSIEPSKLHAAFAHDVSDEEARVMAATQKPIHGGAFEQSVPQAAWKDIPSYFLVATGDRAIKPELQHFMAARMGAKTIDVDSSHVPFLSHPKEVADFIDRAARETIGAPRS